MTRLKARIERLEQRRKARPFPRVTFALFDRDVETIVGVEANVRGGASVHVMRLPRESVQSLIDRAFQTTDALTLLAVYPRCEREEAARGPATPAEPSPATEGSENAPSDPFALAGIGRKATRAELARMGAVRMPPERLI